MATPEEDAESARIKADFAARDAARRRLLEMAGRLEAAAENEALRNNLPPIANAHREIIALYLAT